MPDPIEFENIVADHFMNSGYQVEKTAKSYDYGVDLFVFKGDEKIAIQVKMYDSRKVNHEAVMNLFAAQKYYNCSSSIIITSGKLTKDAMEVAKKLGVIVWENWFPDSSMPNSSSFMDVDFFFKFLWENYVMPLNGKDLVRENGSKNTMLEVNWDFLKRMTSNNKIQKLPIEIFRKVIIYLVEHGEIERDKINEMFIKRASSGISLILSQNPYIQLIKKPKMKLVLNKQLYDDLLRNR
ncbi:MAG: restriction endonuclease [Pelotomaculum sp.]